MAFYRSVVAVYCICWVQTVDAWLMLPQIEIDHQCCCFKMGFFDLAGTCIFLCNDGVNAVLIVSECASFLNLSH